MVVMTRQQSHNNVAIFQKQLDQTLCEIRAEEVSENPIIHCTRHHVLYQEYLQAMLGL